MNTTACVLICMFLITLSSALYTYPGIDDRVALETLQKVERRGYSRRRGCQRWRRKCIPWSSDPNSTCCNGYGCKCNLWMQNCKCVTRLWG